MIRTQVQLTAEQLERLQRKAVERRSSVAALVREAVERSLESDEEVRRRERALGYVGRYHSGLLDISSRHDQYLDDDFDP